MSQPAFNSGKIRELLNAAFTPDELRQLCYDEFRPVYDKLADKEGKPSIIQYLIEHCERRLQVEQLLAAVKKRAPEQYAQFENEIFPGEKPDFGEEAMPDVQAHLKNLLRRKTRELYDLQEIAAKFGTLHTPSYITLQIEDLEKEIAKLQQQLNANG